MKYFNFLAGLPRAKSEWDRAPYVIEYGQPLFVWLSRDWPSVRVYRLYGWGRGDYHKGRKGCLRRVSGNPHLFYWPRGGGGYSHTLPIRVCAFQRGRDFEAPDLERGIHLKLFKDRLLLTIRFSELTSKLLYSCCTLCFSLQGGRILASSDSAILDK